jgi:hypothetical protein
LEEDLGCSDPKWCAVRGSVSPLCDAVVVERRLVELISGLGIVEEVEPIQEGLVVLGLGDTFGAVAVLVHVLYADEVRREVGVGRSQPWAGSFEGYAFKQTRHRCGAMPTVGMAMRDGVTMEAWLDTPSALAAKNLAARLQKNPQGAPLFGQIDGATSAVEQHANSVRVYGRVSGSQLTGSAAPQGTPVRLPALDVVTRSKIAEVQEGMDRAAVEALIGKPHSVMAIEGADEPVETLIYNLADKGTARVRVVNGKVASIQVFDRRRRGIMATPIRRLRLWLLVWG